MNNITFELTPYIDHVQTFIKMRSDIFTGDINIFKDPKNTEYCPKVPMSLYEAMNIPEVHKDTSYIEEMNKFHTDLTIEIISAVLCEHFNSIPEVYANSFYMLAHASIHKCQNTDAACWAKICKAARRSSVPYVTLRDGPFHMKEIPIGITNSDLRLIYQELFISIQCEMRNILPENEWLTVDFTVDGNIATLTLGEDLRHVIFNRDYGDGKWSGKYYIPSGEAY